LVTSKYQNCAFTAQEFLWRHSRSPQVSMALRKYIRGLTPVRFLSFCKISNPNCQSLPASVDVSSGLDICSTLLDLGPGRLTHPWSGSLFICFQSLPKYRSGQNVKSPNSNCDTP